MLYSWPPTTTGNRVGVLGDFGCAWTAGVLFAFSISSG
jgi:hypothetical protein